MKKGFFSDIYIDIFPNIRDTIPQDTDIPENKLNEVLTVRTLDDAF